jgi:hypothetical protein
VPTISLPTRRRLLDPYTTGAPIELPPRGSLPPFNRVSYAAAHVVADPLADIDPWLDAAIDWDRTIAFRHYMWDLGLGVAEAMDTAQRGMGLDWGVAKELIRRTLEAADGRPGVLVGCGVGTDHLGPGDDITLDDVVRAYEEQIETIEQMGGKLIVMASRALAKVAKGPEEYAKVYDHILAQVRQPVILHWLGEMFDPTLIGYWGATDHMTAMDACLAIVSDHAAKVDGIKISLLSKEKEIAMRRRLPTGVRMYTGDDFNYVELIAGDGERHSDALLGIFDAIAPAASAGLARLAIGDRRGFESILEPTVPLSRHIFKNPTRFYKTGVVFLAWLNGLQNQFVMLGGQESARSLLHLAELFRLADKAHVLRDPDLAVSRMNKLLAMHGLS